MCVAFYLMPFHFRDFKDLWSIALEEKIQQGNKFFFRFTLSLSLCGWIEILRSGINCWYISIDGVKGNEESHVLFVGSRNAVCYVLCVGWLSIGSSFIMSYPSICPSSINIFIILSFLSIYLFIY